MTKKLARVKRSAYELHTELVTIINYSRRSFVAMGKLLYELRLGDNFTKAIGAGIDTWDDYIAQPEIHLSRGESERLMQIYDYFVLRNGISEDELSEAPIKSLHYLLPMAKKENNLDISEMVKSASTLSQRDFREVVGDIHYGDGRTYEYMVMKRCFETGSLTKVHDITSEQIKETYNLDD